ncbi:MAG TPA: hypothetical protein VG944_08845 [Fimbriimonas sp.]|nr:hypothetical protein [Fimbriimonas sp.]
MRSWKRWIWGGCGILFGVLLLLPATGWILRVQLALAWPSPSNAAMWCVNYGSSEGIQTSPEGHRVALRRIQEALRSGDPKLRIASYSLIPPEAQVDLPASDRTAAECAELVAAEVNRLSRLYDDADRSRYRRAVQDDLPFLNRLIDRAGSLEPNNGYFQLMRAAVWADSGDEDGAVAQIRQASRASGWDDHSDERAQAVWSLLNASFGQTPRWLQLIYQPTSGVRLGTLRLIIWQRTAKLEADGALERSLQLRRAAARIVGLIRTRQDSVENLWNEQLLLRAAAAHKPQARDHRTQTQQVQELAAFYKAHGLKSSFEPVRHEQAIHDQVAESSRGIKLGPTEFYSEGTYRWLFGTDLLVLFLLLGLVGAGGWAIGKTAYVRDGIRVPGKQLWWMICVSVLLLFALCSYASWQIGDAMHAMIFGIWLDGPPMDGFGMLMACLIYPAALGIFIIFAIGMLIVALVRRRPYLSSFVPALNAALPMAAAITLIGYAVELNQTLGLEARTERYQGVEFRAGLRTSFEDAGLPWPAEYSKP